MFKGQIPFDRNGNQLRWVGQNDKEAQWKDNKSVFMRVRFVTYERGRSAACFVVENIDDKTKHYIGMADVIDVLKNVSSNWINLSYAHWWEYGKRGSSFGLKLSSEPLK